MSKNKNEQPVMIADIPHIQISQESLAAFCQRWKITELALFGSILREDFDPNRSDIDVLVTFAPDAGWALLDFVRIRDELVLLLGRKVDLLTKKAVEHSPNPIRRRAILDTAKVIYVA
jgi:uncharacterized protein